MKKSVLYLLLLMPFVILFDIIWYRSFYMRNLASDTALYIVMAITFGIPVLACFLACEDWSTYKNPVTDYNISPDFNDITIETRKKAFRKAHLFIKKFDKDNVMGDITLENKFCRVILQTYEQSIEVVSLVNQDKKNYYLYGFDAPQIIDKILINFSENTEFKDIGYLCKILITR